jgi:thiol-disulfide isomerase/thioredoxin
MVSFETALVALALLGNAQGETVLLDFYADWCGPCRQMEPAVHELAARGYPVRKVNVDREPELAARFGVEKIPCFVMLVDGQMVDSVVGGTTYSRLERLCQLARAARPSAPPTNPPQLAETPPQPDAFSVPIPATRANPALPGPAGPPRRDPRDSPPADRVLPAGWQLTGPASLVGGAEPDPSVDHLIAATVRLRIEDPDGHSCGSGTIIDTRQGLALILTCGHLFRDSEGKGKICSARRRPSGCRARSWAMTSTGTSGW